tara:strand:- start:842 stop:1051 length:210 start_codon:yes stop_codon:yes gene_type:complete
MKLFIVTSTYYEAPNGRVMGSDTEGVFSTLELAEECIDKVKQSEAYSDFNISITFTIMYLDNTTYKDVI